MKHLLAITATVFLMLSAFPSEAQVKTEIQLSKGMEEPKKSTIIDIVGAGNGAYYSIRTQTKMIGGYKVYIEKYNKSLALASTVEVDLVAEGEDLDYAFTALFNEQLYVFGSHFSKKDDEEKLYAFSVNPENLNISGKAIKVATSKSKRNSSFTYHVSNNRKYMSILGIPGYDKKDPENPTIYVYDEDMKQVFSKKVALEIQNRNASLVTMQVSDKGDAHLLARTYSDEKKFLSRMPEDIDLVMISYINGQDEPSLFELAIDDNKITEISFRISEDGNLTCGGFYSDKKRGTGYKGVAFLTYDPYKQEVIKKGLKEFSPEDLSEFMKSRQAEKQKELELFDLGELVLREDGGLVMVAEKYYVVQTAHRSGNVTYYTYTYYYLTLLVVNVSPDLEIEWMKSVPKRQVTTNDGGFYSSYVTMVHDDKIHILFNDNAKNLTADKMDKVAAYNGKKSVVSMVTLDAEGNYEKELFMQNKVAGIILRPKICEQINDDELFIYGELKKLYRIGVVTFE